MTLIVGKILDNQIRFVSDSKITNENSVRNNPLTGNLKLYILDPMTCLGFAGNIYFAEKLLNEYYLNKLRSPTQLLQRCLQLNIESDDKTVFSIGMLHQNIPRLYKIENKKIDESQKNIWIGEKLGFEKYQKSFHSYNNNDHEFNKMKNALNSVIQDEKIPSVSDFQISVETQFCQGLNNIAFLYGLKATMNLGPQTFSFNSTNQGESIPIAFGGADIGAYGFTYMRSFSFLQPAISIHFPQGEFGVLFCPFINRNKPIIFTNQPDGENFANQILKIYGIQLQGFVSKDGHAFKYLITGK